MASHADFSAVTVPGYTVKKKIGNGGYGGVWLAVRSATGEEVAIKFVDPQQGDPKRLQREILNHSRLRHPNIVRFIELVPVPGKGYLGLVMEYLPQGDLFDYVVKHGRPGFGEGETLHLFQQVIRAVDYMHSQGVISRDIKLENILLTADDPPQIKLCDFGFSKADNESVPKSRVGTPQYIPPEVLQHPTYDGKKADIWCCGVLLYSLLGGHFPFYRKEDGAKSEAERRNATLTRIMTCDYVMPRGLSPECCNLIANLLVKDPARRLPIADIKRHAYFVRGLTPQWFQENAELQRQAGAADGGEELTQAQVVEVFRRAQPSAPESGSSDLFSEHDELDALMDDG
mmetsp:Transcript_13249/g.34318  ORF Transcript_13249/g.34318 Transcript_13249/m.34318 type:complete len:344 (+) Transcript_13249:339-1370(+)